MILQTDLIPHDRFHKGIWLSNEQVPWYFFLEKEREYKIPQNEEFYDSVDELLKPIVKKLHKNKIPTTPSCSGHFEDKLYYTEIYDLLKNFEIHAKDKVILYDEENGKKYIYKNKKYKLPWNKNDFLKQIINYQKKGVLGFQDENKKIYKNLKSDNFIKKNEDGITILLIESTNPKDCYNNWNSIYKQLNQILEK